MTNSTSRTLQPMLISWRFVRLAFGVFLLVTAFLKWRGFGTPNVLFDIAPSLEFGLIQLEVLLALWLMSGWKTVAAWFCTVGLFATFAGASLAMVMQKRSSCGCFGAVDVNPTWALAIDVFAIGLLLLVGRMEANRVVEPTSEWLGFKPNRQKWSLSIAIAFIASAIGFAGIVFNTEIGSLYARNMPIALSGQVLVTEPLVVAAGPGIEGEWQSLSFAVSNRGKEAVRLIGAEQNCKCRAIKSLPIVVPAGEQVDIVVDVKLGSKKSFSLLTSSQKQARLVCRWKESK